MPKKLIYCVLIPMLSACAYRGMSDSDKATVKYFDRKYRQIERYEKRYPNDPFQPYYIKGMVLNEENNEPLIHSLIQLKNSRLQLDPLTFHVTDLDGRFVASVNDSLFNKKRKKISVLIHAVGYYDSTYIIHYKDFKNNRLEKTFYLKENEIMLD